MKVYSIPLPSEENPLITLVRMFPATDSDRNILDRMEVYLKATSAVVARPEIDGKKVLSLMFKSTNQPKECRPEE